MAQFQMGLKVNYNVLVLVEADTEEEARKKVVAGDFEEQFETAERFDWSDPTTDVEKVD